MQEFTHRHCLILGFLMKRFPEWLRKPRFTDSSALTSEVVSGQHLHTVCQSAKCPNRSECWGKGTATFMILGEVCSRECRFCAVLHGAPEQVDFGEPERVAEAAHRLGLNHVVVTSVTRDDLEDGGAEQFCRTIGALRRALPHATIEVLTPDFDGNMSALEQVCEAGPDILNHNLETVERLTPSVRSTKSSYRRSLHLLGEAKKRYPQLLTKSGVMVGLGEVREEILEVFHDLRREGCEMLTVGQYLQPSAEQIGVKEFISPDEFLWYEEEARRLGFREAFCGPFVRSSYHAAEITERFLTREKESRHAYQ